MKKSLITFSNHVYAWLKDATKTGKKSIYVDGLVARRWQDIDTALAVISISGLDISAVLAALDIDFETLPVVGARSRVMARLLPDIGHILDGDESLAYALSLLCQEIQSGNVGLLKKIEEKNEKNNSSQPRR